MPRVLAPPSTSVSVPARREPYDDMEVSAEAGITAEHGTSAPVTPPVEGATSSTVSAGGAADVSVHGAQVHQRDDLDEGGDSRPSKQPRLLRFCEHEEDSHVTHFEPDELDALEVYEYELDDDEDDSEEPQLSSSTCSDDVLKLLTVPFTTLEPDISGEQLLRLDMLADRVEIERLKSMQVLLPVETYDCKGQTPKRLTTRMVRTWRDKHIQGQHVWLRRSRYVAREFAWLSPDRQDLFSPASSVLTVRLLPTLYMKWKLSNYILCAIDIADAFLMVEQKELTQVTCEDAAGQTTEFMLGRVLPGQRNGSQLWHECFSNLLKSELGFAECEAYPCLLRTGGSECLLMLHVDDVLCLSNKDYLECVLLPALKAKFKISCEKVENPGDELTFLKRRHMLLSENELAVQSHPKHLERLFDLMHINRNLKPKRTPGHPMLDEPDDTAELGPSDASTYRSCVGVLLYIAADYVECQYTIRGLSQCMAKPTVRALACLRHLCMYLLGCIDHCIMLSYKAHHGLLHYNELDYTLEVYSDSDWAKHKTTRRSVSAGCLFLFGNLLYSTSRSQKALALSSAEAEIYSAAGACCDGVLMFYCLSFAIGPELEVRFQLCLDNSAARAFFCRSGVGRIRHISLRILWIQAKVKEQFLHVGRVGTHDNPSDIGTKRLTRERMLYLMYLCKIYDLSSSSFVGSNAAETVKQKEVMKQGVKVFTKHGSSPQESKRLMRILLLSALSLPESMAMEFNVSTSSSTTASMFWWQLLCMVLMTALCIALGWIFYLQWQINALQGKCSKLSIDTKLYKVLDLLKGYKDKMLGKHVSGEEENQESDPIVENPDTTSDVHTMASGDATRGLDPQTVQLMRDTNSVLRARYDRLEALYEEAEIVQDEDAMYTLQNQMDEVMELMYDI